MKKHFITFGLTGIALFGHSFAGSGWLVTNADLSHMVQEVAPKASLSGPILDSKAPAQYSNYWIDLQLNVIQSTAPSPPRAARALALLSLALHDAHAGVELLRSKGVNVDAQNVLASAACTIIPVGFPHFKEALNQRCAQFKATSKYPAEVVDYSAALGEKVSRKIAAVAQQDGSDHLVAEKVPEPGLGIWMAPNVANAKATSAEAGWGGVVPLLYPLERLPQADPPPSWNSSDFQKDREAFMGLQQKLTWTERNLATKWAGDPGTVTPAGLWFLEARSRVDQHHLTEEAATEVYAALGVAIHNAFIVCWKAKYTYFVARPFQWSELGKTGWTPWLKTPPFPSYPSGHATISGAAEVVLSHSFPNDAATIHELAEQAAFSRVAGGIHWYIDGSGGLKLGRQVGNVVLGGWDESAPSNQLAMQ